ncbi:MAG: acyl-CoA dehydrogenase family protein [Brevundimonas sp.]|nr:acyl-CoA dehydrogenase family protein [Brevundimonas sp.]
MRRTVFGPEHEDYRRGVRQFFEKEVYPHWEAWEAQGHVDRALWHKAGKAGLLCVAIPEAFGGLGADRLFATIVMEEQARVGASGPGFSLHSEIVAPYLLHYGTDAQKQRYLPRMASGEFIGAIAMTEPGTGSDLQSILTRAEDKGDHYLLNGSKIFITNGYMSDVVIVVAKTGVSGRGSADTSLLLVEASSPGFTKGRPLKKMGMRAQDTCELFFDDVRVPKENLLGAAGAGFVMLMQQLAWERLMIAIQAQASAEAAFDATRDYVKTRHAFGRPVAAFQTMRHRMAEIQTDLSVGRTFVDECLKAEIAGALTPMAAAGAKLWVSEMCSRVGDQCVQMHGGYGFMWEYPVARSFVDNRAHRIYGGTNDIMKELISRAL